MMGEQERGVKRGCCYFLVIGCLIQGVLGAWESHTQWCLGLLSVVLGGLGVAGD